MRLSAVVHRGMAVLLKGEGHVVIEFKVKVMKSESE